jgi:hypothetical protein
MWVTKQKDPTRKGEMAEKLTEQGIEKDQKKLPKGVDKPGEVRYIGKCAG